ncbi:High choriolytic enzyme 2 [Symbiodinium microadriaticum]|uniref:Metalloendopeptidase n=1 Tax=Symbiodinium microadriaticum TaxID=2951 RepID=A0A1Q9DAR6_SYMMI|nr:High choriolytic enzyme 2 [Symbiodinium microadriaticum]
MGWKYSRGMDIFALVEESECRCGVTAANRNLRHRKDENPLLQFQVAVLEHFEPGRGTCPLRAYRYIGHLEAGGLPPSMVTALAGDVEYVDSVFAGHQQTAAEEDMGAPPLQHMEKSSDQGQLRDLRDEGDDSDPPWARACYPHNCAVGRGPWQDRIDEVPAGVNDIWADYVIVPYVFDHDVDNARKEAFRAAVVRWHEGTCVVLKEVLQIHVSQPYIQVGIYDENTCWCQGQGYPGYRNGRPRAIRINLGWCNSLFYVGNMVHEIGHALGMNHEQKRPDAYQKFHGHGPHIVVHWHNIEANWRSQYTHNQHTYTGSNYQGVGDSFHGYAPYDYESIMHYPLTDAYDPIEPAVAGLLGNREYLSEGDLSQVNDMYQCKEKLVRAITLRCAFEADLCDWRDVGDSAEAKWRVRTGAADSGGPGHGAGQTLGYAWAEVLQHPGQAFVLQSPYLDVTKHYKLRFNFFSSVGMLEVDYQDALGMTKKLWSNSTASSEWTLKVLYMDWGKAERHNQPTSQAVTNIRPVRPLAFKAGVIILPTPPMKLLNHYCIRDLPATQEASYSYRKGRCCRREHAALVHYVRLQYQSLAASMAVGLSAVHSPECSFLRRMLEIIGCGTWRPRAVCLDADEMRAHVAAPGEWPGEVGDRHVDAGVGTNKLWSIDQELKPAAAQPDPSWRIEADAMLNEMRQLCSISLSTFQLENASVAHGCDPRTGRTGSLASGASHPLRPVSREEVACVQLASGIMLSQNEAGALLKAAGNNKAPVAPIVLLGSLVQDLGCDLQSTVVKVQELSDATPYSMETVDVRPAPDSPFLDIKRALSAFVHGGIVALTGNHITDQLTKPPQTSLNVLKVHASLPEVERLKSMVCLKAISTSATSSISVSSEEMDYEAILDALEEDNYKDRAHCSAVEAIRKEAEMLLQTGTLRRVAHQEIKDLEHPRALAFTPLEHELHVAGALAVRFAAIVNQSEASTHEKRETHLGNLGIGLDEVNIMDAHGGQDSTDTIVDGPSSKKGAFSQLISWFRNILDTLFTKKYDDARSRALRSHLHSHQMLTSSLLPACLAALAIMAIGIFIARVRARSAPSASGFILVVGE